MDFEFTLSNEYYFNKQISQSSRKCLKRGEINDTQTEMVI